MKKILVPTILILLSLIIAACGSDNDEVTNTPENESTDNQQATENNQDNTTDEDDGVNDNADGTTDNSTDLNSKYNFTSFSLEADVENDNDAVDVEFEVESDETESSYKDKIAGVDLHGDEAMDELDSIFNSFRFDENTADEEVLSEVLEAFNIPESATNVELEIDYVSGTEKEYRQ